MSNFLENNIILNSLEGMDINKSKSRNAHITHLRVPILDFQMCEFD